MRLINQKKLEKYKRKNAGNAKLAEDIDKLIEEITKNSWKTPSEIQKSRKDADCVHSDGFYFFDLAVHRSLVLFEFDEGEATVVWVGNHQEYEMTFKNNKSAIKNWLKRNLWI